MNVDQTTLCMYTPTANGGHALYTHEMLSALTIANNNIALQIALVTSSDLSPKYRTQLYPIYDILPPFLPLQAFRSHLHWTFYRYHHYFMRERYFLQWAKKADFCKAIHFQEYTPWLAPYHFRQLKRWGKKIFYTVHGIRPHKYIPGIPKALFHRWYRRAWQQCDSLFVHSDGLRNELSHYLGPHHPPIRVIPHGVWGSVTDSERQTTVKEKKPGRNLLFFGVIRPNKGLHVLLHAMKELPDYKLTIAGEFKEKSYRKKILNLINQLPSHQINMIDRFIEEYELPIYFDESSLVILPYTSFFGQSGVLLWAVKYGVPTVVSNVGALGESVLKWGIGRCVPPDNASALAEAIKTVNLPDSYQNACKAIKQIKGDLTWSPAAELTLKAYGATIM